MAKKRKKITRGKVTQRQGNRVQDDFGALERAHDIRKFEINLTWKRATYVGAFQGFLFAALGVLVVNSDSSADEVNFFKFVVSIVGVFLSGAWLLINQGSNYWQRYWENKIMKLEKNYPSKHRTIKFKNTLNYLPYAIGRTNMALSGFFFVMWLSIAIFFFSDAAPNFWWAANIYTVAYLGVAELTVAVLLICYFALRKKPRA